MRIAIADDVRLIYSDNWRHGWSAGFRSLGCEVMTVDIASLRTPVLSGPYSTRGNTRGKHLAQQVIAWRPDLVWCYHGRAASNSSFLDTLRRAGLRTACYLPDEPYETGESARFSPLFDYVFSIDQCTVQAHLRSRPFARQSGVFYLPPCADTDRFRKQPYDDKRLTQALFLGNPTLVPREPWLRAVEKAVPKTRVLSWPVRGRPMAKGMPGWIGDDVHSVLYSTCHVGMNIHRDPRITRECYKQRVIGRLPSMPVPEGLKLCGSMPVEDGTGFWNDGNLPASHVNPRFFEMASCGTLVVNDAHRSELARMFPAAPKAHTKDQFVALVQHFVDHPDEAAEIGSLCSDLISKRHSFRHRAAEALILCGLKALVPESQLSSLGEPADWMTPQDLRQPTATSSSAPTGR